MGVAFVHARGGDGSDVVSAVVLHWFKMRRKEKKKKRKTYLNVLVEPNFFVRRWGVCARGKLDVKGTKDLHFFLRGGTKYSEWRRWLVCTHEAHKGRCHRVAGVPQKGDMTVTG